jgi:hypothetical protein
MQHERMNKPSYEIDGSNFFTLEGFFEEVSAIVVL